MAPLPNGQMPAMARNSVDLPAPEGPVTSTLSPPGSIASVSAATSGWPFGSRTRRSSIAIDLPSPSRGRTSIGGWRHGGRLRLRDGGVEAVQPRDDRAPFRQLAVDVDEDRERLLHAVEGARRLHQRAELDLPGEIGRADQDEGKHR